jgi:predicted transcriptional regulator
MRYKSRDEIIGSILQSAASGKGVTKTKIMYSSFLSYPQLLYYLDLLISEDLLGYDSENKVYKTKQKGLEFLELNKRLTKLIKIPT